MITQFRAEPPVLVAAGTIAGLMAGGIPLALGLPGAGAAVAAALVAALTTGLAAAGRAGQAPDATDAAAAPEPDARAAGFDAAPPALILTGPDGRITHANAALHDLFARHGADTGLPPLPLSPDGRVIGADIRLLVPDYDRRLAAPGASALPLGGMGRMVDLRLSPLPDGGGAILAFADVTAQARKMAQRAAVDHNHALFELAPDGRILRANAPAARLAMADAATISGRFLTDMTEDGSALPPALTQTIATGHATARLQLAASKGGTWLDLTLLAVRDDSGKVDHLLGLATDVSHHVSTAQAIEAKHRTSHEGQALLARHLGDGLTALALGDLTHRIVTPFPAQYEPLRQNFNTALDRLSEALVEVLSVTAGIRNDAAEMNAAAEDLSRRTEGQAATLEETAAALDELTASVRSAAESAASADQSARAAHREAEESGRVVTDAVEAMGQIEVSSRQISQIIGVIDEIAFQTNLLALNAGVEAARAGEAGRGFAVVASEVRALAQRSSEAAREIKALISASSRQVQNGVTLVGQAGGTLRAIVAGVTNIAERVSALAQSSREQATGITEINSGVTMLDQVTQQNAAMVEESTAASNSLHRAAESLATLMQRFRLDGVSAQPMPAQAMPRDAKVTPLRPSETGQPRESRAPARLATAQSGWEEF